MADDFQVGSCNWWESSRNHPSSSVTAVDGGEGLGWNSEATRSSAMDSDAPSISAGSNLLFHDTQKLQEPDSTASILTSDSDLQMMGLGLNSHQTIDWNPNLLRDGEKTESGGFRSMLQDHHQLRSSTSFHHPQEQWRQPKLYSGPTAGTENSAGNIFKQSNRGFSLDNQPDFNSSNTESTENFNSDPMIGYGSPSAILLQGLLASEPDNRPMNTNFAFPTNYGMNSNDAISSPWHKLPHQYINSPPTHPQQFPNTTPFWQNSPTVTNDTVRPEFFQSISPPFPPPVSFEEKPHEKNAMEGRDLRTMGKKNNNSITMEPSNKRARSEATPSPLPAFKVRKEKMGDRITALQQLVSPFGKTDTASVLSEAIEYIKFLHEQVGVLSGSYLKNGASMQQQQHQNRMEKSKEAAAVDGGGGGGKQDLRSRGLCLVPVSSTFPVTHEPTVEYWNPTFGGTFR